MFSQSFVMLSILLVMSGISLKAQKVNSERFAGSYSNEESAPKMSGEGTETLLAVRILERSLGSLVTDGLPAEKSKQSPDLSSVKREAPAVVRSLNNVTHWPRRTFTFPHQYRLDLLRGRKIMVSRRNTKGTRFSLSLDVPTNILSILIDLAKAKDMRAKAAANAELMARIGK
ncbi:urocortin 3, like [Scyliorhinus torazame]|uniref:urocortin 3, like n=1 Tax=Scyliorhinus torazame TaxID=75743 RepID=UPI003B5A3A2F